MEIRSIQRLLRIRFTRHHLEREIDEEIVDHIARRAESLIRDGMPRDAAFAEATRRFGDVSRVKEACIVEDQSDLRRARLVTHIDHLRGDLRFALRSFKRAPGFAAVALATLVVGIASVTAIFSAVYGYAYRPLPYRDANRIIAIEERRPTGGFYSWSVSLDAARAIVTGSRSFERISIYEGMYSRVELGGSIVDWATLRIDTSFVPLFAIQPQRGRVLTPDEIAADAPVAMISDMLWRASFGADTGIVGRRLRFGDELVTVVGVMPEGFRFPLRTDVWRPARVVDDSADARVTLLGKMSRGVSRKAAASELQVIARRLAQSDPQQFAHVELAVQEMLNRRIGGVTSILALFVGAAVFVLFIACSNVANLLLVRAAERRGEMAVRSSLGAGRARLVTQALAEAIILSVVAGVLGTWLSKLLLKLGMAFVPSVGLPSWMTFEIDGRILLFTIGIVTLVTLAVGLTPAREATRFDLVRALKAGGDGGTVNSHVTRSARRTIVLQLALSVALFVGGSLLVKTYQRLSVIDLGYPAHEIATITPFFSWETHRSDTIQLRYATDLLNRVAGIAGVRHAAIRAGANIVPLSNSVETGKGRRVPTRPDTRLFADGDTTRNRSPDIGRYPRNFAVTDDYFRALDLRIQRGRAFAPDDVVGSRPVAVVSQRLAETLWPGATAVGREMQFGANGTRIQVIGVVEDVRDIQGNREGVTAEPRNDAYFSLRQVPAYQFNVLARGTGDVRGIHAAAQTIARQIDPRVTTRVSTMAESIETQQMVTRIFGTLIGGFALCGLALSVIGIYGVVAYSINQRTRELGIRIALGATSRDVLRFVLTGALRFVTVGLAIGLALSLGTTQLLRVVLLGVSPTDPITYAVCLLLFGGVALLACYVPARRVTRIDPLVALRSD